MRYLKISVMTMLAAAYAFPAHALRITNLDTVPHRVALEARGAAQVQEIEPNATEYMTGASQGYLTLLSAQNPTPARGVVQADGMLSGIIGNGRTQGIPADPDSSYVIWPGGRIMLQSRIKDGRRG